METRKQEITLIFELTEQQEDININDVISKLEDLDFLVVDIK